MQQSFLIEDEAPLRVAVKKMLARAGFTVIEAADGAEAIKVLHVALLLNRGFCG
jgi:DNA-binding response OmpR family regulator